MPTLRRAGARPNPAGDMGETTMPMPGAETQPFDAPVFQPPVDGGSGPYDPSPTDPPVGTTPPTTAPKPTYNTDGFANPAYQAAKPGGVMSGWDATKWGDANHQTPKYVGGRIFSQFNPNDPSQWAAAAQEFIRAYPGSTYDGSDKITMPDGRVIDFVVNSSGDGPKSWSWQDESEAGAAPQAPMGGPGAMLRQPANAGAAGGAGGSAGASGGTGTSSGSSSTSRPDFATLYKQIMDSGYGDMNMDIVNRRTESAREGMERTRKSQLRTDAAKLADRGLMGSGAESTAITGLSEDLGDIYAGATRDIYADESAAADRRIAGALGIDASLFTSSMQNDTDRYGIDKGAETSRYNTDASRDLGFARIASDDWQHTGNLALGNQSLNNQWNQFLAQHGLDSQVAMHNMSDADMGRLIQILGLRQDAVNTSANGYE